MKHLILTHSAARVDPSVTVIHMEGELNTVSTPIFKSHLVKLLKQKRFKIVLDMKKLQYISLNSFALMMILAKETRKNKGDIKIAEVSPDIYPIFQLLEFRKFVKVYNTVNEAVRAF